MAAQRMACIFSKSFARRCRRTRGSTMSTTSLLAAGDQNGIAIGDSAGFQCAAVLGQGVPSLDLELITQTVFRTRHEPLADQILNRFPDRYERVQFVHLHRLSGVG